ncbi:MAG: alpha/beta hydrolase [Planctomycetota bacterium]|jgi:pimeloyl-ACP methyl ester carboxylesterase
MSLRPCARKLLLRRLLVLGVLGLVLLIGASVLAGHLLTAPRPKEIGPPSANLAAEPVAFESGSGSRIRGWLLPGRDQDKATVVLAHGIGGDRRAMLSRARFLRAAGYTALVFDFQAHGESPGKAITFGYRESRDVRAAVAFVRARRPGRKIGVIGQSLGGAACLIGDDPIDADALIVESVYPTLQEAVQNRMEHRLGFLGRLVTPLLTWQSRFRLGFAVDACRPIRGMRSYRGPVLIVAGAEDQSTRIEESRRMFLAAVGPKQLWVVAGAGHVDYHTAAGAEYEKRVLGFLDRYL